MPTQYTEQQHRFLDEIARKLSELLEMVGSGNHAEAAYILGRKRLPDGSYAEIRLTVKRIHGPALIERHSM